MTLLLPALRGKYTEEGLALDNIAIAEGLRRYQAAVDSFYLETVDLKDGRIS